MAYSPDIVAQATTPGGFFDVGYAALLAAGTPNIEQTIAYQQFQQQIAAEQAAGAQGGTWESMTGQGLHWIGGANYGGRQGWMTPEQRTAADQAYFAESWAQARDPGHSVNGVWYPTGVNPGGGTTATPATPGTTYPTGQTAAQRAATMLYNAMRGLPFISPEFLMALQAGQAPAPRTVTPQTLAALSADSTLSDAFFSVIKANALYPASYLAEIGRYIPRGREATPSFI